MKSLRAEREKHLRETDTAKVRQLRSRVKEIQREISAARARHPKERRALLDEIRGLTRGMRKAESAERARMARAVAQAVADFRKWWAEVMAERKRRLAEIATLRQQIREYSKARKVRVHEFVAVMEKKKDESLDDLDERHNREADELYSRLNRAKKNLTSELYDQKAMKQTAKQAAKNLVKLSERRQEFTGGVEANLTNAIEQAVWKKARKQILAEAKRKRVTAADGVAELVREYAEQHADQAYQWLQSDVEKWMTAELERKGYAA